MSKAIIVDSSPIPIQFHAIWYDLSSWYPVRAHFSESMIRVHEQQSITVSNVIQCLWGMDSLCGIAWNYNML